MTHDPVTGLPLGQIGTLRGWAICRTVERLPFGRYRLTVTALKGATAKWRDYVFKYATPEGLYDIAQEMESEVRQVVCEIEELEESWARSK